MTFIEARVLSALLQRTRARACTGCQLKAAARALRARMLGLLGVRVARGTLYAAGRAAILHTHYYAQMTSWP